jgi:undecaprenyl diphosphate synthase
VMADAAPEAPRHIAIIMDGNGRWAAARALPRPAGHKAGLKAVRLAIEECSRRAIEALTLFAFSSENWSRPADEVGSLMRLFIDALDREIDELHRKSVRVRFIGARANLAMRLQTRIAAAEARTADNPGLKLQVAMSYGGRWDIIQAAQKLGRQCASGAINAEEITTDSFARNLALAGLPPVDLLIRTGGEHRISNFLLWDLAYAELHFSSRLWPDFSLPDFEEALAFYAGRERRFGRTGAARPFAEA